MIWRRSRTPGRHRDGQPGSPVPAPPRRLWDGHARAEAERLTRLWRSWTVLYGPGSRRFYAVAAWPTPEPLIIEDRTPEGLEARMHQVETAVMVGRGVAVPDGRRAP